MSGKMTKESLLQTLQAERVAWDRLLTEVGEARMGLPVLADGWSVADVIAHVSWYEREATGILRERALRGSPWWALPHAQRNAHIHAQNQGRALAEILMEAEVAYAALLAALEAVTDDDLMDATRFAEMPASWQPWQVVAENSYEHYRQHAQEIRAHLL